MAVLSSGSGFPYFNNQIDGSGMRPQIAAVESLLGQVRLAYKPLLSVCQDGETFQHSKLLGKLDQVICLLLVKLADITELANSLEVDGAHIVGEAGQLENETRASPGLRTRKAEYTRRHDGTCRVVIGVQFGAR